MKSINNGLKLLLIIESFTKPKRRIEWKINTITILVRLIVSLNNSGPFYIKLKLSDFCVAYSLHYTDRPNATTILTFSYLIFIDN